MDTPNAAPHLPQTAPALPTHLTARDGLKLALTHWPVPAGQPLRGVVSLVHGLGEHAGRYAHVARHLNHSGWAVVAHDHRGHGRSDGPRGRLAQGDDLLHDLATVLDTVRQAYAGQRLALLGHSLGGLVVARFVSALATSAGTPPEAQPWRREVDLCVLSSPALDIGMSAVQRALLATVGALTPDVAVSNGLNPSWVSSDPAVVKAYVADPLVHDRITGRLTRFMLDAQAAIWARAAHWATPTLLMYAGADRCVRPAGSERFAATVPADRLRVRAWPGLSHEIFNEPAQGEVLAELQAWLDAQS